MALLYQIMSNLDSNLDEISPMEMDIFIIYFLYVICDYLVSKTVTIRFLRDGYTCISSLSKPQLLCTMAPFQYAVCECPQ